MTPGARVQAAIEILDAVIAGDAAERALTRWSRASRFAGSKDRRAVRDFVFEALRRARSAYWASGEGAADLTAMNGRHLMAGLLASTGQDVGAFFTGEGHAPPPIDVPTDIGPAPRAVAFDCQDWLLPRFDQSLGDRSEPVLEAMKDRAPVILRANIARISRDELAQKLQRDGIETTPHPVASTALVVSGHGGGLDRHAAYEDGLFEFQDAGSQHLVERLPILPDQPVLDLCSGGGGKALAMAARGFGDVSCHDVDAGRMRDLPNRARRAGARLGVVENPADSAPFAAVVADVPCSGSGSWRRAPEAKWRLTEARLDTLVTLQAQILDQAIALTAPGGWVAYMTCSMLADENAAQVTAALSRHAGLELVDEWSSTPLDGCDGFYLARIAKG